MLVYLVRHGETTGDLEDRFGGDFDDSLTEQGKKQSTQLAEQLVAHNDIKKLYASPLMRAQETSSLISQKLKLDVSTLPLFKERNSYGILSGMVKSEAKSRYPVEYEAVKDPKNSIEGAEGYQSFKERVLEGLNFITRDNENCLIVTHGGVIRLIFREVLKLGEIKVADCAIAVLENNDGNFVLKTREGIELQEDAIE